MFWGLSESLDLCQEYLKAFKVQATSEQEIKDEKLQHDENATEEEIQENTEIDSKNVENAENVENINEANQQTLEGIIENLDENLRLAAGQEENENELTDQAIEENLENQATANEATNGAGDFLRDDKSDKILPTKILNVLLFGSADPRHVVHTMSKLYKHQCEDGGQPNVNFYIVEGCLEILARYIVLLGIALENVKYFSVLRKTHLFMDVYGNSLLRPSSDQYLSGKAKTLLKILTDNDFMQEIAPILDIEDLKYVERDGLEQAFYFWYPKNEHIFDIKLYWDNRNRKLLGARYDYRNGAFDWDLSMTLKERQGHQICSQEYRYWRETGIAFTYPEFEQCQPNKTLAAGLIRNGTKYKSRGYVGDIQTGPFCAFGLKTAEKSMCKSMHGENDYRATEITERNLLEMMYEIQVRSNYEHNPEMFRKLGPVRLQMCKRLTAQQLDTGAVEVFDQPWIDFKNVRIHFLSMDEIANMQKSPNRFANFFDIAFVGQNYFTFIKDEFVDVLKDKALLLLETKLLTVLKRETVAEFETKLKEFAKKAKLQPVINYNALNSKNTVLKYKKNN